MAVLDRCYAYASPTFQPAMRIISAITNANPMEVTTTFDHDFVSGTIVRLVIPPADGMQQVANIVGAITVTGATTFTMDIDSSLFDVFAIPADPDPHLQICALVLPIGELNSQLSASTVNVL